MKKRRKGKQNRQMRTGVLSILFIVCSVVFLLSVKCVGLIEKNQTYAEEETQLESDLAAEEERSTEFVEYAYYVGTDAFVEEVALERLGLVYEDEIIFEED